jgi:hemerythrin
MTLDATGIDFAKSGANLMCTSLNRVQIGKPIMTTSLRWNDSLLLGYGPMDITHRDFVECVARLREATSADVVERLARMADHLTAHFDEERQWMMASDFPATQCHVDEHEAVLRSAHEVRELVDRGNIAEAHRFADALANWFEGHLHYMDAALSHWMSKRAHGGVPLVFRRDLAAALVREDASMES